MRPAITAGTQPPLGVIDTTQPIVSAAWIDVVPRPNASRNAESASSIAAPGGAAESGRAGAGCPGSLSCCPLRGWSAAAGTTVHRASRERKGFVPPWNAYGSPGFTSGSFRVQSIVA